MYAIFDVDGTLTPGRGQIDPEFKAWLIDFAQHHAVCLATGSDLDKTVEQLGQDLVMAAAYSFNCLGNEVRAKGQLVHQSPWTCPDDLLRFLQSKLLNSPYRHRAGRHFEARTGMLNFSVVGRNAQGIERKDYYHWDCANGERESICAEINRRWPAVSAMVGGETGIDIFARGTDKSQVLRWLPLEQSVCFFGDKMDPAGNDHSLAQAILTANRGRCYHVTDWKHTWQLLRELDENNLLPQGRA